MERIITNLGLSSRELPVTRLSLQGYLGYAETIVLEWLERPRVSRSAIEQLILAVIGTALRAGLGLDGIPDADLAGAADLLR